MSLTIRPIFICKANVWRSQIAEWIFNSLYWAWSSLSIAWLEARKGKYHGSPDTGIIQVLKDYKNIDISLQKIKYLSDLPYEQWISLNLVVFLFDPTIESICDDDCKSDGLTPYEYFKNMNMPMIIHPILDPFEVGPESYQNIIDGIEEFVMKVSWDAL